MIAHTVAKYLDIPWISTDQIRDVMRALVSRKEFPKLFNPEGYNVERFLTEFSAEQIVEIEIEQGEAIWPMIKKFIEEDYTWKDGFVIEGVNILPHLIAKDFGRIKHIKSVFLFDEDVDRVRNIIFSRGLSSEPQAYSNNLIEKELEWVLLFSRKLKANAQKYSYPCVQIKKSTDDMKSVLKALDILDK